MREALAGPSHASADAAHQLSQLLNGLSLQSGDSVDHASKSGTSESVGSWSAQDVNMSVQHPRDDARNVQQEALMQVCLHTAASRT